MPLNASLFAEQVDLSRVVLAGHSNGAGGVAQAGPIIAGFNSHLKSLSYGFIAPVRGTNTHPDVGNVLVVGGTMQSDSEELADPEMAYAGAGTPKTLVTVPGANHFGYTDICPPDNTCQSVGLQDLNGGISRDAQQRTAGAYLAAVMRYYALGDATARPYLSGERMVEGLESLHVTGIQVHSQGFIHSRPTPAPNH